MKEQYHNITSENVLGSNKIKVIIKANLLRKKKTKLQISIDLDELTEINLRLVYFLFIYLREAQTNHRFFYFVFDDTKF